MDDVVARGRPFWLAKQLDSFNPEFVSVENGYPPNIVAMIGQVTEQTFYDMAETKGQVPPPYAGQFIQERGDSYFNTDSFTLYSYLVDREKLGVPNLYDSKIFNVKLPRHIFLRKFTPWLRDVDATLGWLRDMGFWQLWMMKPLPLPARPNAIKREVKLEISSAEDQGLSMGQVLVMFVYLFGSLVIGIFLFAFELYGAKRRQHVFRYL